MSTTVNVAELKNKLTAYLALVEKGQSLVVCRRNIPIAKVEPLPSKPKPAKGNLFGCMKGTGVILGDLTEPCIPEDDWEMLK